MSDFEVHPIGTAEEIRLSRALANAINEEAAQWEMGLFPHSVRLAYQRLEDHYMKQMEMEESR